MNDIVHMLWIGDKLSKLELLSIQSFIQNNHPIHFHCYNSVQNVPDHPLIEIHNANRIVMEKKVFKLNDSYSAFANYFRYLVLWERGGWWADCDTVLVKSLDKLSMGQERISIGSEWGGNQQNPVKMANNGNIFCRCQREQFLMWMIKETEKIAVGKMRHAQTGPELMRKAVVEFGLEEAVVPPDSFCPINWWEAEKFITEPQILSEETFAIHMYGTMFNRNGWDKDATYPYDSLIEVLKRKYDVF